MNYLDLNLSSCNRPLEENTRGGHSIVWSNTPRLQWDVDLHRKCLHAIEELRGEHRATPISVLQKMNVPWLTIVHVYMMHKDSELQRGGEIVEENMNHGLQSGRKTSNSSSPSGRMYQQQVYLATVAGRNSARTMSRGSTTFEEFISNSSTQDC